MQQLVQAACSLNSLHLLSRGLGRRRWASMRVVSAAGCRARPQSPPLSSVTVPHTAQSWPPTAEASAALLTTTPTACLQEALFKPVPFGETGYVSLFSQATSREYVEVWDLFRSVDMDKESRVLKVRGGGAWWAACLCCGL